MSTVIRYLGKVKDQDGYEGALLQDEGTGKRYIAYSAETLNQRLRDAQALAEAGPGARQPVLDVSTARLPTGRSEGG